MLHPIYRQSVWSTTFEIMARDGVTPADLTSRKVSVLVKREKNDQDSQSVLPRVDFQNSDTNKIVITYYPSETGAVAAGDYWMAVKIFGDDNNNEEIFLEQIQVKDGGFQNE